MATVRISAAISAYVSHTCEFRSRCPRKEASGKWCSTTPSLITSEILSPLCCSQSCTCFSQPFNNCVTTEPGMSPFRKQDRKQHSSEAGRHFWFPTRHHSTPHLQSIAHRTVLHDVQCRSIRQQAQDVVQIRAVCCVTWSQRILPDLNVLRARCSHQLTQSRCHRRTACSHFEQPCCPSFLTIMLARIHVRFRQEFRVYQAQTSSHLGLCHRNSLCCLLHQVAPLATLPVHSTVESRLLLP